MISLERRDGRPLRIGHRGAAGLAPENTLRSFRAAVGAGVDLVELDLLELDDGTLVVAHSYDLHEVSHGAVSGTLHGRSLDELRTLCPELPTIEQALELFADEAPATGVHVDVKSAGAVPGLARALGEFGLRERALASAFDAGALRRLAVLAPEVRLGISFPEDRIGIHGRRGSALVVRGGLRALRTVTPRLVGRLLGQASASVLVLHHALASPGAVRAAHGRGAAVVAWTVDDPRDLARVDAAGVDAVVVDDPAIFVSTLQT